VLLDLLHAPHLQPTRVFSSCRTASVAGPGTQLGTPTPVSRVVLKSLYTERRNPLAGSLEEHPEIHSQPGTRYYFIWATGKNLYI